MSLCEDPSLLPHTCDVALVFFYIGFAGSALICLKQCCKCSFNGIGEKLYEMEEKAQKTERAEKAKKAEKADQEAAEEKAAPTTAAGMV